jgi:ElaB/YqjD/DUF883 family membrane-anchored ribosome-binding protein
MANKLQNIKAIQKMLDGTHAFQTRKTHGFTDAKQKAEKNKRREIGEIWEEKIGNTIYQIEQQDGFRVKKPKNSIAEEVRTYLNSYPNCKKDCCKTKKGPVDEKMRVIHGMCLDCVVDMEHELKKQGKYEEYEQKKIRENAEAWLKRAEQDVDMLKQVYTQASSTVMNADGMVEHWSAKMTPDEFEKTIQTQFDNFKVKFLKNLETKKENND